MKRIILLIAIFSSFTALAQTPRTYRIEGIAQRFSTALGIPVKASSFFNTSSDTAIVFIDPSDTTTIHFKYKGVAKKLAASNIPWDSITAKPSNFTTTYALSNDVRDSVQNRVPYENATRSLVLGNYRLSARGLLGDTIYTRSSTGGILANNSGQAIANYGAGGGVDISFNGFAGMDYNRSGSMSSLSFTPKVYTDSLLNLKSNITDSTDLLSKTVRTFGNQSGILGNKIFTNNITANSLIKSSGTADQLLVANGDVQSKADIHNGAFTFDTTGRLLTIPTLGGGSYSVLIPRGTASGAEGITALTSNKVGNLVTVFGDNGSSTTFSIRDTDSTSKVLYSDTAAMLSNLLRKTDTSAMLSNYRRTTTLIQQSEVSGLSTSLAAKLNISDTATMLSNYRRATTKITNSDLANSTISGIALGSNLNSLTAGNGLSGTAYNGSTGYTWQVDTGTISTKANVTGLLVGYATTGSLATKLNISDTAAMLTPFVQYSDTANMLSPYARTSNLPDFSAKLNVSDTASMLSNYRRKTTLIENADLRNSAITINGSSTSLGSSISVGTVTSVGLSVPTGFSVSNTPITSSGTIALGFTAGYALPTTAKQSEWDIAYNKRITSASFSKTQLTLTAGDASTVTVSVPTFDQNTTGTAGSLSAVLSSTLGGAGSVSGILKANGSGTVSAAVAGTDYVAGGTGTTNYIPKFTASGTIGNSVIFNNGANVGVASTSPSYRLTVAPATSYTAINTGDGFQIDGDAVIGTGQNTIYSVNPAIGSVIQARSSAAAGILNLNPYGGGVNVGGELSGTSFSMSGGGSFGGAIGFAGDTRYGVSKIYNTATGDMFGIEQVSAAQVGGGAPSSLRVFTAGVGSAELAFGKYTSATSFTNFLKFTNAGEALFNGAVADGVNTAIISGSLKANSATFNSGVKALEIGNTTDGVDNFIRLVGQAQSWDLVARNTAAGNTFGIAQSGVGYALQIATGGAATFSSSVTASTDISTGSKFKINGNGAVPTASALEIGTNGVGSRLAYNVPTGGEHNLTVNGTTYFYVNASGIGTSSSVTATSFSISNGSFASNGFWGSLITAGTGSFADYAVLDNTNTAIMHVPTGTRNVTFGGSSYAQGYRFAYAAKSSNYTLTDNDDYITVTNASTITLPTAVGRSGKRYVIRSTAGSGVASSLATTSFQTIDGIIGPFSFGWGNYNIIIVFSDGSNWLSETFITGG